MNRKKKQAKTRMNTTTHSEDIDIIRSMTEEISVKEHIDNIMMIPEKNHDYIVQVLEEDSNGGKRTNSPEDLYEEYLAKLIDSHEKTNFISSYNTRSVQNSGK